MTKLGSRKLHICPKVTKMGSIIGHRIDYNRVGALRGQQHIPSKNYPKYPHSPRLTGNCYCQFVRNLFPPPPSEFCAMTTPKLVSNVWTCVLLGNSPVSQDAGCRCTLLAGNSSISLAGSEIPAISKNA